MARTVDEGIYIPEGRVIRQVCSCVAERGYRRQDTPIERMNDPSSRQRLLRRVRPRNQCTQAVVIALLLGV